MKPLKTSKIQKFAIGLTAVATVVASNPAAALACTQIYIGKDLTTNGDTFIGRGEDNAERAPKVFGVEPAADHDGSDVYSSEGEYGDTHFEVAMPAHTLRYTYLADSTDDWDGVDFSDHPYPEAGVNEKGVSVSATLSTYINENVDEADPTLDSGIGEYVLARYILSQANTAREGVELLGKTIDEHGASETYQITIADASERWIFCALSGHQWLAVRPVDGVVSVNPNLASLLLDYQDSSTVVEYLASKGIESMPKEAGFAKYFADGHLDVANTYTERGSNGQYTRLWQGLNHFNPNYLASLEVTPNPEGNGVDYISGAEQFFAPSSEKGKIDTYAALRSLAERGAGTEYDTNVTGYQRVKEDGKVKFYGVYPVCNYRQVEAHLFQIRDNMPADIATVQWTNMSHADYGVFIPSYSALLTETAPTLLSGNDITHEDETMMDVDATHALVYTIMDLNELCNSDRAKFGTNVAKYVENLQREVIAEQEKADEKIAALEGEARSAYATFLAKEFATQVNEKLSRVVSELRVFSAENTTETFVPSDFNAETGKNKSSLLIADAAGWQNVNGSWMNLEEDGGLSGLQGEEWEDVNGKWYLFDADGKMLIGWQWRDGEWYYMGTSGAMHTGWVFTGGKWYYFDASGRMLRNTTIDGWTVGADGAWIA